MNYWKRNKIRTSSFSNKQLYEEILNKSGLLLFINILEQFVLIDITFCGKLQNWGVWEFQSMCILTGRHIPQNVPDFWRMSLFTESPSKNRLATKVEELLSIHQYSDRLLIQNFVFSDNSAKTTETHLPYYLVQLLPKWSLPHTLGRWEKVGSHWQWQWHIWTIT